jgi:hypothetical protein
MQLGTLSTRERAFADGRGAVTPGAVGWSLEWWIGAEDRWYVAAREPGVRQTRIDSAPVVETALKVPGGDAVHRAYAAQVAAEPVVVVEVENRTAVPFAVALVVVPRTPGGSGHVRRISAGGASIAVDGRVGILCPRRPARVAAARDGEVFSIVTGGDASESIDGDLVRRDADDASAAFVFPVSHRTAMRVLLPLRERADLAEPFDVPGADDVARGWATQVDRGPRLDVPDDRFRRTFDAARRDLLLAPTGEDVVVWPDRTLPWTDTACLVEALDLLGFHTEAEQVLAAVPDEQRLNGAIVSADGSLGTNGAVLWAIARHWQLTGDTELVERLVGPIAKAGHWIDKHRRARRSNLVRDGSPRDVAWSIAGLRAATDALAVVGQPEVAEDFAGFTRALAAAVEQDDEPAYRPVGDRAVERAIGAVLAGDRPAALTEIIEAFDAASAVSTWSSTDHAGPDVVASASFCTFLRHVLVHESPGRSRAAGPTLWLCNLVPDTWLGQSWEVRDLPTSYGRLGYAVRWHGDRPALLWEIVEHDAEPGDRDGVTLTAPGLDPAWRSTEPRGEALLAPVPDPADPPGSTGDAGASSSFT